MGTDNNGKMKMYRQEKLIKTLLDYRLKKHGFSQIKVEVYDRFDGDSYKCRLEFFKGGTGIKNRIMKYEGVLDEKFVLNAEERLLTLMVKSTKY